ncbi:hypothetical protein [Pseudomonas capeferrum]|uniref:hypothetical protein n=1 Tax=Pseudomonas capeferrum TaxID=1495066 RepID=UPI0015E34FA3|nr:hypothetical protein [Pseudomonas capeferrum]
MSHVEPRSPLTIIAIFAGIIEASALASLPFLSEDSQTIYTWFLVGFPFFLTILFFLTLNFNYKSLYSPLTSSKHDPPPGQTSASLHSTVEEREHNAGQREGHRNTMRPRQIEENEREGVMIIALSGPETRKMIENHVLRIAAAPTARERRWIIHNLDTRTSIHLAIRPSSYSADAP